MNYTLISLVSIIILNISVVNTQDYPPSKNEDTCQPQDYEYKFNKASICSFPVQFLPNLTLSQCRDRCGSSCECTGFVLYTPPFLGCTLCIVSELTEPFLMYKPAEKEGFYARLPKGKPKFSLISSSTGVVDDSWKTCDGKEYEYYNTSYSCSISQGLRLWRILDTESCKSLCSSHCGCKSVEINQEHNVCILRYFDCPLVSYRSPDPPLYSRGHLLLRHEKGIPQPQAKNTTCEDKNYEYKPDPDGKTCYEFNNYPLDVSSGMTPGDGYYKNLTECQYLCSTMCACKSLIYGKAHWGNSYCVLLMWECAVTDLCLSDTKTYYTKKEV